MHEAFKFSSTEMESFTSSVGSKSKSRKDFFSYTSAAAPSHQLQTSLYLPRVVYVPVAIVIGLLGYPVITIISALKRSYMLVKGWHRLFNDCIGREGPFLESICVPFTGLAILLWPFAVAGAS